MTSPHISPLGLAPIDRRYKGVGGVGEDGSGDPFRELVPNLVVVHPLSNCRDTLGLEKEFWKPWKEGLHHHFCITISLKGG